MKTEPSRMLRQVWDMKDAAEAKTRRFTTARAYFGHIRKQVSDMDLPEAPARRRPLLVSQK